MYGRACSDDEEEQLELELDLEEAAQHEDERHGLSGGGSGSHSSGRAAEEVTQLTSLYSVEPDEHESLHDGTSSSGMKLMEQAEALPQRTRDSNGKFGNGARAEHEESSGGCSRCNHCADRCGSRSTRVKLLLCLFILAALWIPAVYVWHWTRSAPQHAVCLLSLPAATLAGGGAAGSTLAGPGSTFVSGVPAPWEPTPPDTLIAYVGDVGLPEDGALTGQVYDLVAREGAHALVIQGDLDYDSCPGAYDELLTRHFGESMPVFTVAGNHDVRKGRWPQYSAFIARRWARANVTTCLGLAGEAHTCTFRGIVIVQASPGVFQGSSSSSSSEDEAEAFIRSQLSTYSNRWQTCSWHKNQALMQTGDKSDETGWGVYEACREAGALVATGHEHSYARTGLLTSFSARTPAPPSAGANSSYLPLSPGSSLAFVNGLGGKSSRPNDQCNPAATQCPWFASLQNADTGVAAAVLFCRYNDGANLNRAYCYLKDTSNVIRDEFVMDASAMPQQPVPSGLPA